MSGIGVALVGWGYVGRTFHAPLIRAVPGLELRAVVSSQDGIAGVTTHRDLDGALADPAVQLVVIAAPNEVHAPLAERALAAGRHVVVDKPFTVTLAEARRVVAASEAAGRLLSVFQNRRWDADFLALREQPLGAIAEYHSHFDRFRPAVRDRWREQARPGSGLWFDLGPHLVDQALRLLGRPEAVWVDLARQRDGAETDDCFHAVLRYPRARAVLHAGTLVAANGPRFAVHGTMGSWVKHGLDPQEDALKRGETPGGPGWGVDPRPGVLTFTTGETAPTPGPAGDYAAYYVAMRDAILDGAPLPVTPAEALDVMAVLEAGLASHAERREIAL